MSYCFNFFICLVCIILQTILFPNLPVLDRFYDLIIPFIIYLGIYRPISEAVVTLILVGMVMDGLSGGVVGLHVTAYVWIYLGTIWLVRYLHLVNSILLPFVVAGGVLLENLLFVGIAFGKSPVELNTGVVAAVAVQFLLAVCTGPFVLLFYRAAYARWEHWAGRYLIRRKGALG